MKDVDCENTNEIKNFSIQIVRKQWASHGDHRFFIFFCKGWIGRFFQLL